VKIKSWHLIVVAIIVFLLDFFTLGNRQVIDNPITNQIAGVVALVCVLLFVFGIIKGLHDLLQKNREAGKVKREQEEEQGIRATGVEIGFRRLLAILLMISVVPLGVLLPVFGLILGIPNLILALYLLLNRGYHLIFNFFLVLLGSLFYFVTFPLNVGFFALYKTIELSACPGYIGPIMAFMNSGGLLAVTKYLFLTASLFLFAGDIIARLKLAHKRKSNTISLITICLVLGLLPYLYVPRVALGESASGGTGSSSGFEPSHFSTNNASYDLSYDQALKTYAFTAKMVNQDGSNSASITTICVDGNSIPITKENSMLQVDNGLIAGGKITVAPAQTAIIKLVSQKPFYAITLLEGMFHYSTNFLK
jgi:hypothetical protein